ncbi:hypothetical protein LV84_03478 [Algoriphagus ratkowskyi]|uniref:Threonine synthase n=2 Tax=Algoriphagus ratkowskyi TaxID=57028 RepID=A0A2W7QX08_9BACT|nr:DUF6503 family protein [Algoriphagus ratkowskyi]PZX52471.1 hypothetical protein LV84_03478 [Algoriphagus ratkowskyi]
MKNLTLGVFLVLVQFACTTNNQSNRNMDNYPDDLIKVLNAHGGLELWDEMQTLQYSIPKEGFEEVHTIDLHSRMDRVAAPAFDIGYDGTEAWSKNKAEEYEGDPSFRHDLMFYFYAMPFVLADDGINYGETEPLVYEGKSYPGIEITYNSGVGSSSEDIYMLYYDAETYKMAWLGYKATFGNELKAGPPSIIKYEKWAGVNGILIPTSIAWQTLEEGKIVGERNRVNFTDITLSKENNPAAFYTREGLVD